MEQKLEQVKLKYRRIKKKTYSEAEEENIIAINKKVVLLKKEFTSRTFNHIGNLYTILNKIVQLKKAINPKYTDRSLEWEKDLDLTGSQIRYIFAYQYIAKDTEQKVKEGLILDSTVCHFLAVSALLREPQWQRLLVKRLIDGDIKVSQISELTKAEQKKFLLGKLELRENDDYFFTATKTLRSMKTRLHERKHLIKDSPFGDGLIIALKELNNEIKK